MIMHPSRWGLLLLGLVMASCESGASLGPVSPAELQALIESAATTSPTLHPGEKIDVIVFGEDRLSGEYEIDPAGFVSLPLAGTIKAAGLSKQQLERDLSKKFSGEYLRNPRVTVDVTSFRPFYIMGTGLVSVEKKITDRSFVELRGGIQGLIYQNPATA
jgi:protein involved in polysaccharide export with SLBB domain